jgi:hypothetical protein
MKHIILFASVLLSVSFSLNAQGLPLSVYNDDEINIKIYFKSIRVDGDKIYFWDEREYIGEEYRKEKINDRLKFEFKYSNDVDVEKWMKWYSDKIYNVINKKTRKRELLSIIYYTKDGEVIESNKYKELPEKEWSDISPQSIGELIFEEVCKYVDNSQ